MLSWRFAANALELNVPVELSLACYVSMNTQLQILGRVDQSELGADVRLVFV